MQKIVVPLFAVSILVLGLTNPVPVLAHEEICSGNICVEGGWVNEPPLVDEFNGIVLTVTRNSTGEPVANALSDVAITINKGTLTKTLDFVPTEETGVFSAEILPTQIGQVALVLKGTIAGQAFDGQLELEDVEDKKIFEFPPRSGGNGSGIPSDFLQQFQDIVADLNSQVEQATTASEKATEAANAATDSAQDLKLAADRAYLFGMVGVGAGVAGIILGVIALTRGKEKL